MSFLARKIGLHFSCIKVSTWCLCLAQHKRPFVKPHPPMVTVAKQSFRMGSFPVILHSFSQKYSEGNPVKFLEFFLGYCSLILA